MPFTLSHAAAVLPFIRQTGAARGPLVASALVAGSFAPDLPYYADTVVPGGMAFGTVTHSLPGVLTVDVLISAALVGGWLLLREPLVALLPRSRRERPRAFARGRPWTPRGTRERALPAGWFFLSAVLGSVTHVVWDAFTHPGRWGTRLVPALNTVMGGRAVAMYLQYATSALALAGIGWFLWAALRGERCGTGDGGTGADGTAVGGTAVNGTGAGGPASGAGAAGPVGAAAAAVAAAPAPAVPELALWPRLLLTAPVVVCTVLGGAYRTARAYALHGATVGWFDYVPDLLFGAGAGLMAGLLGYAVTVRLLQRRAHRGRAAAGGAPGRPSGAGAEPAA
ncbi:DUF4184 family protein [Streptomyces sp. CT34]|uniref:DUF4184 family protein n=1 Tax=Streptomyces sp. CT34 TaxID=1553907 RepID=UPI0005BBCD66|nr:DUF4184 family protein [Streptomyces sp. CT34]